MVKGSSSRLWALWIRVCGSGGKGVESIFGQVSRLGLRV